MYTRSMDNNNSPETIHLFVRGTVAEIRIALGAWTSHRDVICIFPDLNPVISLVSVRNNNESAALATVGLLLAEEGLPVVAMERK